VIAENGGPDVVFLKCTAAYPAPYDEMNLRTMTNMAQTFQVPTGLSDHSLGDAIPVAAVAMGASMIEKHLTLSRAVPSPDSSFSLEPEEFREMVEKIRNVEAALGTVRYGATENEAAMRTLRRSLFVVRDMKQGEPFTDENVRCIRPGHGLKPRYLDDVMGKCASTDIARGTPLRWELISRR
ncbi:MAG: N-acetylneuraminate synthase family protein, partial [Syntrophaceae bacterium]|nr:N-acetylneuraminate synthase family protein [Syntrophaceae bacterium]